VAAVTREFLRVFGLERIVGRDFAANDDKKGAAPVALVGHGYWRQHLGSAHDLSQSHLKIDNAIYSVIGVLLDFDFRMTRRSGSLPISVARI